MNDKSKRHLSLRRCSLACILAAVALLPSCATITGTATGAFTGLVDLPNELIYKEKLKSNVAETWLIVVLAAPVGFAMGPVFGFVKGFALDVSAVTGAIPVGEEFGTYHRASVWRPYSYDWTPNEHE